jgi:murein DD-endopeptidase MepM/ murein hydrolase activator NlpD
VVVRPGDSASKIAKDQGVELRDLIEANRLRSPYRIYPGQRLALPRVTTVTVAESSGSAPRTANGYGIEAQPNAAAAAVPTYRIAADQARQEPVTKTIAISPAEAALAASAAGKIEAVPAGPLPAGRVQMAAITPLPAAGSIADATVRKNPVEVSAVPSLESVKPSPIPSAPSAAMTPEQVALAIAPRRNPVEIGTPPPRSGQRFLWPVRGDIIVGFGPREGGLQNDGINIRAGRGTTVRAAESGVVAYAGNELRGFGNLLLIKHADGWMSAYAHNDALMVKTGDRVRRGQPISRVGSTGSVAQPQLHFELRRGSRAVDPIQYLTGGEA